MKFPLTMYVEMFTRMSINYIPFSRDYAFVGMMEHTSLVVYKAH